jgi:hypothetical protein
MAKPLRGKTIKAFSQLQMKSLSRIALQAPRHAVQKKAKLCRRETPKTPRFAENGFAFHSLKNF